MDGQNQCKDEPNAGPVLEGSATLEQVEHEQCEYAARSVADWHSDSLGSKSIDWDRHRGNYECCMKVTDGLTVKGKMRERVNMGSGIQDVALFFKLQNSLNWRLEATFTVTDSELCMNAL